ncbi:MAG TPA: protein-glutamate O-methyltransferase CheR [Anaerolineae bacterium]|nr:protein-glutamate O-methyltransferase CheR [Anaerolineae bacterium]
MPVPEQDDIEEIETNLFLEAIFQRYGYDFRHYARASVKRRVQRLLEISGCTQISEMIPRLLHDEDFSQTAIQGFSIAVTEMFRDPDFYRAFRQQVVPYLKTYPYIRVWHAGCAMGEEVYSLAIVLQEEGLYERSTIFATDFNDAVLDKAREGIYTLKDMRQYSLNYLSAGGTRSFADYYHAKYELAIMDPSLKRRITFASHNLATDGVFSELQVIFCRNVLIYFDKDLQKRVLGLFAASLAPGGFLCLGSKESLQYSDMIDQFKTIDERASIYQKRIKRQTHDLA